MDQTPCPVPDAPPLHCPIEVLAPWSLLQASGTREWCTVMWQINTFWETVLISAHLECPRPQTIMKPEVWEQTFLSWHPRGYRPSLSYRHLKNLPNSHIEKRKRNK